VDGCQGSSRTSHWEYKTPFGYLCSHFAALSYMNEEKVRGTQQAPGACECWGSCPHYAPRRLHQLSGGVSLLRVRAEAAYSCNFTCKCSAALRTSQRTPSR